MPDLNVIHSTKYKVIETHKPIREGEKTKKGFYNINK